MRSHALLGCSLLMAAAHGCSEPGPPGEAFHYGPAFAADTPVVHHRFRVVSTTRERVRILGHSHSCSCTHVNIDRDALDPGEECDLALDIDVPPDYANLELTVDLKTDHPRFPLWTYRVYLESFPRVRIEPRNIDLGSWSINNANGKSVDTLARNYVAFYVPDEKPPPRIHSRNFDLPDNLTLFLDQKPGVDTVADHVLRYRFAFKLQPRSEAAGQAGSFSRALGFSLPEGLGCAAQVLWSIESQYEVEPGIVSFGSVSRDAAARSSVRVRSLDGRPFSIRGVACEQGEGLIAEDVSPTPSSSHEFSLLLRPEHIGDDRACVGRVVVQTDRPGEERLVIP